MDSNKLKISIITVCFNSVHTIEQTIRSVVTQDYDNLEYIIIDGGSTDGTKEIIQKYNSCISNWISEPDKGIYDAMNKGVAMATGDVIAFLNSGDWYKEGIINFIAKEISESQCAVSCFDVDVFDGNELRVCRKASAEKIENLRIGMIYCHQAIFARRFLFEKYGDFNTSFSLASDYEWILRMYNQGVDISYRGVSVANFREGGISSVKGDRTLEEMKIIAISALNELLHNDTISKEYYEEMYDKIAEYYEEAELKYLVKYNVERRSIMNNEKIRDALKKTLLKKDIYSIFGCGFLGEECLQLLEQTGLSVGNFYDNNLSKWGTFFKGICVKSPQEIVKGKETVIICSTYYFEKISEQLNDMGLSKEADYIDYNEIRERLGMLIKELI